MKKVSSLYRLHFSLIRICLFCILATGIIACQSGENKRSSSVNLNTLATKVIVDAQDSSDPVGRVAVKLVVDSMDRQFYYHFPEGLIDNEEAPRPVVFFFHGQRSSAEEAYLTSGWKEKSETEGFLAVFPSAYDDKTSGNSLSWNNGAEELPYQSPADDTRFFSEMIRILDSLHSIDRTRLYATGLGTGAGMVIKIALEQPDLLAAIGPVSGLGYASNARPGTENVVSCLAIQGLEDPLLLWKWSNPKSDANAIMNSQVGNFIKQYTRGFGFNETYEVNNRQTGQYAVNFGHSNENSAFIFMMVNDLKYGYPGALDVSAERHGKAAVTLNASEVFWAFFRNHPKVDTPVQ